MNKTFQAEVLARERKTDRHGQLYSRYRVKLINNSEQIITIPVLPFEEIFDENIFETGQILELEYYDGYLMPKSIATIRRDRKLQKENKLQGME